MNDLISRRSAIDALKQLRKNISGDYTELDPLVMAGCGYIGDCIGELECLPSAQPYTDAEIQKMQDLEQAQFDKMYQLGYEEGKQAAQPQRKMGEWIEDGYSHYKAVCSECGEPCATYIMGKPRDRFCKWCGADMRGDEE